MKAYAKINLSLDVLYKRADNFHDIESVMQQIGLYDELEFEESDKLEVKSQFKDDIVKKAALKLKELFDIKKGIKIIIKKNIPVGAGLAGGSADAAAALLALNKLWGLNLDMDGLMDIGIELGADIPFCLVGNCCFVSGIGENIKKIDGTEIDIVLVNPGYEISTKDAYNELDKKEHGKKQASLKLKNAKTTKEIAEALHNDFMAVQKDDVKQIIKEIIALGALNASITGKGPTVFGIFETQEKAKQAYEELKGKYQFVYQTKTMA